MTIPYPLAQVLGFPYYASGGTAVSPVRSSGTGQSQSKRNSTSVPAHLAAWHHRRGLCCGNVVQDFNGSVTISAVSLATTSQLLLGPAPFHLVYGLLPPWFLHSRCLHLLLRGSGCCVHVRGRPEVSNHPWLFWSRGEMAMSLARWFFLQRSRRLRREVLITGSVSLLFINSLFRVSFKESVWASRQTERRDCIVSPGRSLVRCLTTHRPYSRYEVASRRSTCSWPATSTSDGVASSADCYAVFGPTTSKYRSMDVRLPLNDSARSFARILSLSVNSGRCLGHVWCAIVCRLKHVMGIKSSRSIEQDSLQHLIETRRARTPQVQKYSTTWLDSERTQPQSQTLRQMKGRPLVHQGGSDPEPLS